MKALLPLVFLIICGVVANSQNTDIEIEEINAESGSGGCADEDDEDNTLLRGNCGLNKFKKPDKDTKKTEADDENSASVEVIGGLVVENITRVEIGNPYPWFVGLIYEPVNGKSFMSVFCMGSVISARDVLSAAHCLTRQNIPVSIVHSVGKTCTTKNFYNHTVHVVEKIMHPLYKSEKPWYDFAVLRLERKIDLMPVCLPSSNDPMTNYGFAVVFNRLSCLEDDLVMPIFKTLECRRMLLRETYYFEHNVRLQEAGYCAGYLYGNVDTCQGDSGGPFQVASASTHLFTILGVTSFGFGCKVDNTLGVYGDVRKVVWWIRKVAAAKTFVRGE